MTCSMAFYSSEHSSGRDAKKGQSKSRCQEAKHRCKGAAAEVLRLRGILFEKMTLVSRQQRSCLTIFSSNLFEEDSRIFSSNLFEESVGVCWSLSIYQSFKALQNSTQDAPSASGLVQRPSQKDSGTFQDTFFTQAMVRLCKICSVLVCVKFSVEQRHSGLRLFRAGFSGTEAVSNHTIWLVLKC